MMNVSTSPLSEKVRDLVCESLNARVADSLDLYNSAKVAHWNVRDPRFSSLHHLFDDVASFASSNADKIAERIASLGGVALGRSEDIVKASSMPVYPVGLVSGDEHLAAIAKHLEAYNAGLHESISVADDNGDVNTVTMLSDISLAAEETGWMVQAHIAK